MSLSTILINTAGLALLTLVAMMAIIGGPVLWEELKETWNGRVSAFNRNLPDRWFYSRDDPPWQRPRTLCSSSDLREAANYAMLMKRLTLVGEQPLRPSDYAPPKLYVDARTGQHWLLTFEEAGFNQWRELNPVAPPDRETR